MIPLSSPTIATFSIGPKGLGDIQYIPLRGGRDGGYIGDVYNFPEEGISPPVDCYGNM